MKLILAVLLASVALGQKPILFENVTGATISDYLFVGLPDADLPTAPNGTLGGDGYKWTWCKEPHGIRVFAERFAPVSTARLEFGSGAVEELPPFKLNSHLEQYYLVFIPQWRLGGEPGEITLDAVELQTPFTRLLHRRWWWASHRVTVDLWCTFFHQHAAFEWAAMATYGDVRNDGQSQSREIPALTMASGGPIQVDFWKRLGVPQYVDFDYDIQRFVRTFQPMGLWHRARRYPMSGAILVADDPGMRQVGVKAAGLYLGWDGKWLGHGAIPLVALNAQQTLNARKAVYWPNQIVNAPRDRAQPPTSGQTGEQKDFGVANGVAVTLNAPWEMHDALYHCQSYALRPTANKEPGGAPMTAAAHPLAQTYNQRPDLLYGLQDRLGWPGANQIEWITGYTTSDDEHRADNLLHATIALTREPWLCAIVDDHVELHGTDVYGRVQGRTTAAARAEGRMLLTQCMQVHLGFEAARPYMQQRFERILQDAAYKTHNGPVKMWSPGGREAKYGWSIRSKAVPGQADQIILDERGKPLLPAPGDRTVPVRGIPGWEDVICAVQGLVTYHRVTGDQRALDAAVTICRAVVDNYFYEQGCGRWQHCYAIRWNGGQPWPLSSYAGVNVDTYTDSAADYWTVSAAIFLARRGDARGAAIAAAWGWPTSRTVEQSQWWALQ